MRTHTITTYTAFVLTGTVTTLLGSIVPLIRVSMHLSDSQCGELFTAQFLVSFLGAALSTVIVSRTGTRLVICAGLAFMALGVAFTGIGSWPLILAAVGCYGFGLGLCIPTINLLVAKSSGAGRASALNLLNFFWSIGAVLSPPIILKGIELFKFSTVLIAVAAVNVILLVASFFLPEAVVTSQQESSQKPAPDGDRSLLALTAAFLFIYVGTEVCIGGWISSLILRSHGSIGFSTAFYAQSAFWGALLVGRLLAPLVLRHIRPSSLVTGGIAVAGVGAVALVMPLPPAILFTFAVIAGFGLAPLYPTAIALFSERAIVASKAAGLVFACAGLGGATLPAAMGFVSDHFGELRLGFYIPLAGVAALFLVHSAAFLREVPAQKSDSPTPA